VQRHSRPTGVLPGLHTVMSNEEKLEEIKRLCSGIMETWGQKSSYNEPFYDRPYEDGQVMGRSTLAETILEIINNG